MTLHGVQNRYDLPDNDAGYQLDPLVSFFSVVLPLGSNKTNLVANPSAEVAVTGYLLKTGGAVTRDSSKQKFGTYSIQVPVTADTTDGVWYNGVSLTTGVLYIASVWFYGQRGLKYQIRFRDTGFASVGQITNFTATGFWQRVSCTYLATATATYYVYITKNTDANVTPFWIDGLQVERDQLTTYIDGDQTGFISGRLDYYWEGTPHASISTRIGQSAAGGKVIPLSQVGFRLMAIVGLGLGGITNFFSPKSIGGSYYNGTIISERGFSLVGRLYGNTLAELSRSRQGLVDLLKPDRVYPPQPLLLRYQPVDDCGLPQNSEFDIICVFDGDLSGPVDNIYQSGISLNFRLYLPVTMKEVGNSSAVLGFNQSISNANNILMRTPSGIWQAVSTGADDEVRDIVCGSDGSVYITGLFTLAGGVANTSGIAKWNGSAFTALGTGLNIVVDGGYALAVDAGGILYVGGDFADAGGVANTDGIAKWNGSAWSAMGTGGGGLTQDIVVGPGGTVYVTGTFNPIGGVANTKGIALWSGGVWLPLGTGLGTADGRALVIGPDGLLYVAGSFTTANGVTVNNIAKWNGTTFVALAGGAAAAINALAWGPDGYLYAGGTFSTIGGISAARLAKWNGSSWSQVGSGLSVDVNINGLNWIDGLLYINGSDIIWNGSSFVQPDVTYPAGQRGLMFVDFSKNLYSAFQGAGTANSAQVTVVNNAGSAQVGPTFHITGPGVLREIRNYTNGKSIYFNLITFLAGETAVLDLSNPSTISFVSNRQGNIIGKILGGSNLSDFTLVPGNNNISVFMTGGSGASLVNIVWRNSYHSIDAASSLRLVP